MRGQKQDNEFQHLTRDEAVRAARAQATRDLVESESSISYVAFVPDLQDYCLCEYRLEPPYGWMFSCRMLPQEQRHPSEQITDLHIAQVARSGNRIAAIRLYRGKYGASLAEGTAGVERLLNMPEYA
jgi:hypothetical protein